MAFLGTAGNCASACGSESGVSSPCVDCTLLALGGGAWYRYNAGKRTVIEPITKTVMADSIGLYDSLLGGHRHFNISAGVPGDIVAELDSAARNNTRVEDLNAAVLPYEIH
ncbi:uncharacterized protein BO80DRAFT_196156 [Aspergillus ibericus CBS 121593]|uniref:Uncharacterized protein n=1 Tax=Aspergillus ibericus CBS 121593 TaxID=1448316 RepID=A0A395GPH3_9EURO|nr:hypothetical protein BO80DRAFT_196156 [Aspergillus ibericus CBS 121593]RAK97246.1 hypothetical protein BO80DRAFT_196156 [Aspergillus ibericus CBS 121593]